MRWPALLFAFLLALNCPVSMADSDLVRHPRPDGERDLRSLYFVDLLRLSLDKTRESHGAYRLETIADVIPQSRALIELGDELDVIWTMTSEKREQLALPVRIPLLKGLMGYRLLIIRQQDENTFAQINSLKHLRTLRAGQGHDWPDADILQANGLEVVRSSNYDALFHMLRQGRFDYLPRGLMEPWDEVLLRPDLSLMIEPRLLIQYPTAMYFFVHPDNHRLAERIETGLRRAIRDSSFDQLFYNHPVNRSALEHARLDQRMIIRLFNPLLPARTPLSNKALWFSPQATPTKE